MELGPGKGWDELIVSLTTFTVAPAEPTTVLDALQQRLNRYREAGIQARANGDERKARMHDRIAKVSPLLRIPYPMLAYPCFALPVCFPYDPWPLVLICLWSSCCFGTPFLLGLQSSPIPSFSASLQ